MARHIGYALLILFAASLAAPQPVAGQESPPAAEPFAPVPDGTAPPAVWDAPAGDARGARGSTVSPGRTMRVDFPVSPEEVRALVDRGEMPRLSVTNRHGGMVTGRAVSIDRNMLRLDVSAEGLGLDGVLGIPMSSVVGARVMVPLTDAERRAAETATAEYLDRLRSTRATELPDTAPLPSRRELQETPGAPAERGGLLAFYPPEEGWGPERLAEITRKAVVLHLQPFGRDRSFLKDYPAWAAEYREERVRQLEQVARWRAAGEPVPPDFEVLPELVEAPTFEGEPAGAPSPGPVGAPSQAPVGAPSQAPVGAP